MTIALALIALALIVVGPLTVVAPDAAAGAFGIPVASAEARAYLRATATRDVALGVWLLALLRIAASRRTLAVSVLAIALVAAGDAANVLGHAGWRSAPALAVHVGGLGALLLLGWWLWIGEEP